uniref:SNF2_N domain-containing protein n=1 Tax=Macrostomum lignano TaxID=282301 RepID=A0A1I8F8S2_9PLAT
VPGSYGAILCGRHGPGQDSAVHLVGCGLCCTPARYSATKPLVRRALIVTPGSLVANWRLEFYKWLPWARSLLDSRMLYCALAAAVGAKRRIVLTGTPVQNDLDELYTLVDFVSPGRLGNWPQFRAAFVERIAAAADSAATEDQLDKGRAAAEKTSTLPASLPPKRELVIFCRPSDLQRRLFDVVCGCAAAVEVLSDELGHTARLADGEHLRLIGLLRQGGQRSPALLHAHLWSL